MTISVRAGRLLLACAERAKRDTTLAPADRESAVRTYTIQANLLHERAARAAEELARLFRDNRPDSIWWLVNGSDELLDSPPEDDSSLRRESAVEADHILLKAMIREAIRRVPEGRDQYLIADVLSTAPEGIRDPELGLKLARGAFERNPADPMCLQSLSWALYRAGDWADCLEVLAKSSSGTAESEFILAMAHWRLGNKDEARDRYRRGDEWLNGYEKRVEERLQKESRTTHPSPSMLKRLRAEAAALLGVGRSTPEQAPPPRAAGRK